MNGRGVGWGLLVWAFTLPAVAEGDNAPRNQETVLQEAATSEATLHDSRPQDGAARAGGMPAVTEQGGPVASPKRGETSWSLRANAGLGIGSHGLAGNLGVGWEDWCSPSWAWGLSFLAAADAAIFGDQSSFVGAGRQVALRTGPAGTRGFLSLGFAVGTSSLERDACGLFGDDPGCKSSRSRLGMASALTAGLIVPVGPVEMGPALRFIRGNDVSIVTAGLEAGFGARH